MRQKKMTANQKQVKVIATRISEEQSLRDQIYFMGKTKLS